MNKNAVDTEAVGKIDINDTVAENINNVAKAKNKAVEDILAVVLSRPRHEELIAEIRATGARIKLIQDGDVAGAINTAFDDTGVRSEEHTSELQSRGHLVCRLLL